MNAISTIAVPSAAVALVPTNMDEAIKLATMMSSARLVPKHLQGDVGSCLMVVEQAMRWRMSPFAVAQCTSNIGGKLMYEGKLVAAAVETSGAIEGGFDYTFKGDGDDRAITVAAKRVGETNPRQMTIKLKDVKTSNEHWNKQPDQQLVYSANRNWARRWTPSVILGVYSPEEFNRKAGVPFDGPTIEGEAEVVKDDPPAEKEPPRGVDPSPKPTTEPPKSDPPTWQETVSKALEGEKNGHKWLALWRRAGEQCPDTKTWTRLHNLPIVKWMTEGPDTPKLVREEIYMISKATYERLTPPPGASSQPGLDLGAEPPYDQDTGEITPADRLASG